MIGPSRAENILSTSGLRAAVRGTAIWNGARAVKRGVRLAGEWARGKANRGHCTICDREVWFIETGFWLRDKYLCSDCGSIPRQRALIKVLNDHFPEWRQLRLHESSPGSPSSDKMQRECASYIGSQFFADIPRGESNRGQRSED